MYYTPFLKQPPLSKIHIEFLSTLKTMIRVRDTYFVVKSTWTSNVITRKPDVKKLVGIVLLTVSGSSTNTIQFEWKHCEAEAVDSWELNETLSLTLTTASMINLQ